MHEHTCMRTHIYSHSLHMCTLSHLHTRPHGYACIITCAHTFTPSPHAHTLMMQVHTWLLTRVHMYSHACAHTLTHFTRVHTHTLTHTVTCICMRSHTCTHIHSQPSCTHTHDAGTRRTVYVCSCVLTCMCTHSHTIHTCAHLHMHTLLHTHKHTQEEGVCHTSASSMTPPQMKNPQNLITKFREEFICFLDF